MDSFLKRDLEAVVEVKKTPEEWAALAKKIKSQKIEKPKLDLFNLKGAAGQYLQGPKAAYKAVSGGMEKGATSLAKKVGFSPETVGKIGDVAGSPEAVAAVGGLTAAGAAGIIYAGYKIYKRYMTDMGRACGGSPNKKACELQYQIKAKQAQVESMTNNMGHHCKTAECHGSVYLKINKLKREIDDLQYKLSRYTVANPADKKIKEESVQLKEVRHNPSEEIDLAVSNTEATETARAVIDHSNKFYAKNIKKASDACNNDSDPKTCGVRYNIRVKKEQLDILNHNSRKYCKTKHCFFKVDLKMSEIRKQIKELQKQVSQTAPPERPESERREDEIFKGHHPAVK